MSLASARLGSSVGNTQSGILYLSYTLSALLGSTYVTKFMGARNAMVFGMVMYTTYVSSFIASVNVSQSFRLPIAAVGGAIGGAAAGVLWTAQGAYFARVTEEYKDSVNFETSNDERIERPHPLDCPQIEEITSKLGGIFAAFLLGGELIWRLFSTISIKYFGLSWEIIFFVYFGISILSTFGMIIIYDYKKEGYEEDNDGHRSITENVTVTFQMITNDRKIKYMIPLCALFGFAAAFVLSFVNGAALKLSAIHDTKSAYVGLFSSLTSGVAGVMSLVFGFGYKKIGKGIVLLIGSIAFFLVGFLFLVVNDPKSWNWAFFIAIYTFQGIGRATYEGTLRSRFVDFFGYEKEGAFANMVLFNGLASTIGFFIGVFARCSHASRFCIQYKMDGKFHNVLVLEILVILFAVLSMVCYYRAFQIYSEEKETRNTRYSIANQDEEVEETIGEAKSAVV